MLDVQMSLFAIKKKQSLKGNMWATTTISKKSVVEADIIKKNKRKLTASWTF